MKVVLLSILIISVAFIGLGISIFFRRNGKFPETEIGHNKHMKKLGITCVKCDEGKKTRKRLFVEKQIINPAGLKVDFS